MYKTLETSTKAVVFISWCVCVSVFFLWSLIMIPSSTLFFYFLFFFVVELYPIESAISVMWTCIEILWRSNINTTPAIRKCLSENIMFSVEMFLRQWYSTKQMWILNGSFKMLSYRIMAICIYLCPKRWHVADATASLFFFCKAPQSCPVTAN